LYSEDAGSKCDNGDVEKPRNVRKIIHNHGRHCDISGNPPFLRFELYLN
jgi:hypothetical protein